MAPDSGTPQTTASARRERAPPSGAAIGQEAFLAATEGSRSEVRLRSQETVFGQGDAGDAVFYVQAGRVQITVISDQGKEGVIALFGPGDFFGEGCLAGQAIRTATATATAPSTLARIEKDAMSRLLRDDAAFSGRFVAFLLLRNIQVEADVVDHLFNSSEKRLARILVLLANANDDGELQPISPRISQETLASWVGTTRSRINHFMNKFRRLGLIEYKGELKVHTALLQALIRD